ncbi:hypothetical protein GCM10010172_34640 [Paractinoplanes ferrugineus]|uniref:Uncharacterized protein n=1 Tax=Paractinoplanes ferrugineus TaxID=113564 RepID=A0A919J9E0_9ACTN|nr:hypothetical protein Afe05nite_73030 [Actinoplanes ferrugineus]
MSQNHLTGLVLTRPVDLKEINISTARIVKVRCGHTSQLPVREAGAARGAIGAPGHLAPPPDRGSAATTTGNAAADRFTATRRARTALSRYGFCGRMTVAPIDSERRVVRWHMAVPVSTCGHEYRPYGGTGGWANSVVHAGIMGLPG